MALEIKLDQLPVVISSKDIKKWAQRLGFNPRHSQDFGSRQTNIFTQLSSSAARPYWRHIMAHTLLPEEAENIKKNILLRHLRRLEKDECAHEAFDVLPATEHKIYLEYSSCMTKIKLLEAQTKSYEETLVGLASEIRLIDNECFNHTQACRELSQKRYMLAMSLRTHAMKVHWCRTKTASIKTMLETKLLPLCPVDVDHSIHFLHPTPNSANAVIQHCFQLMKAAEADPTEDSTKGRFMLLTHHSRVPPQELLDSIIQCLLHVKRVVEFEIGAMETEQRNEMSGSQDSLFGSSTNDGLEGLRSEYWELELKLIKERCSKADVLSSHLSELLVTISECYPIPKVEGASMAKVDPEATINQLSDPRYSVKLPDQISSYDHGENDSFTEDSAVQHPDKCNDFCVFVHDVLSTEEFLDGASYKFTDTKRLDLKCEHSGSQVECNEPPTHVVSDPIDADDNLLQKPIFSNEQKLFMYLPKDIATELNNWLKQLLKHETMLCLTEKIKTMVEENKAIAESMFENYSSQYPVPSINEYVQEINELIQHLHSKSSLISSRTYERLFEEERRSAEEGIQFLLAHPLKDYYAGLKDFFSEDKECKKFVDFPLSINMIGFYSCSSRIKMLSDLSTPSSVLQHTSMSILQDATKPTGFEPPKKHDGPMIDDDFDMEKEVENIKKKFCNDLDELEDSIACVKRKLLDYQELRTFWAEQPLRHAIPADLTVEGYTYGEWYGRWQSAVEKLSSGKEDFD